MRISDWSSDVCSSDLQHCWYGLENKPGIEKHAFACNVLHVESHALLIRRVAATARLPKSCEARTHKAVVFEMVAVAAYFRFYYRARADNAHIAAKHVDQLRKLIEAELAHDRADAGNAREIGRAHV